MSEFNKRIIKKIEDIRTKKNDNVYFKNMNLELAEMPSNKTANFEKYQAFITYSSQYVDMLHDFNMINTSRKWKHNRYIGKYKVFVLLYKLISNLFYNLFLIFRCLKSYRDS